MTTSSECTDDKLRKFSLLHYTYINQIFGDMGVREIISEVFPNNKYFFKANPGSGEFASSNHHVLVTTKDNKEKCSVEDEFQNVNINSHDTLCQSYSLLTYRKKKIHRSQKQRQMDMIKMYREFLENEEFIRLLSDEVIDNPENKKLWRNFASNKRKKGYVTMKIDSIVKKVNQVLDIWEAYGYYWFIGDGTCPLNKIEEESEEEEESHVVASGLKKKNSRKSRGRKEPKTSKKRDGEVKSI